MAPTLRRAGTASRDCIQGCLRQKRADVIWRHGSFSIPTGSVTAIVAPTAGKTTMMKAELGLIDTTAGSITVLGKPAGVMNQHIGYVPQRRRRHRVESHRRTIGVAGPDRHSFRIHPVTRAQREKRPQPWNSVGLRQRPLYRLSELSGDCANVRHRPGTVSDPQLPMLDEPPRQPRSAFSASEPHRACTAKLPIENSA